MLNIQNLMDDVQAMTEQLCQGIVEKKADIHQCV